jgi:hypothetical protein
MIVLEQRLRTRTSISADMVGGLSISVLSSCDFQHKQ